MCQNVYYFVKEQFRLLVMFSPIFVADTKIIFGYNFVAHLTLLPFLNVFESAIFLALLNAQCEPTLKPYHFNKSHTLFFIIFFKKISHKNPKILRKW